MDTGIRNKERLVVGRFEQVCLLDTISKIPPAETCKPCYTAQKNCGNPEEPWPGLGLSFRLRAGASRKTIGSTMPSIKAVAVPNVAELLLGEEYTTGKKRRNPILKKRCNPLKEKYFSLD